MPDFDLNSPATFAVGKTNFTGNFSYTLSVVPDNPALYKGPQYITVTSQDLLTENQILALASDIALNTNKYQYGGTPLDLTITEAKINPLSVPEV